MNGWRMPYTSILTLWRKSVSAIGTLLKKYIATKVDRTYLYDNSVDDAEQQLLIRLSDGLIAKRYVNELPEWAKQIVDE